MDITRKIDTETFKGTVTFSMPTYEERVKLLKERYTIAFPDGSIETDEKTNELSDKVTSDKLEKMYAQSLKNVSIARTYVKEFSVVCKHDEDVKITSINDLLNFEEGGELVGEFAETVLGGVKLGNGSAKE